MSGFIIEVCIGSLLFIAGLLTGGKIAIKLQRRKLSYPLNPNKKYNGMELVGVSKDHPITPHRENVYRLEVFCTPCKLWNAYEGKTLISISGDMELGCCSNTMVIGNDEAGRKILISNDRRSYFVTPAMIVYKQFTEESK